MRVQVRSPGLVKPITAQVQPVVVLYTDAQENTVLEKPIAAMDTEAAETIGVVVGQYGTVTLTTKDVEFTVVTRSRTMRVRLRECGNLSFS